MKTHVVLVNPAFVFDTEKAQRLTYNDLPLNIALLASILISKGYTAEIVNANIHADWEARVLKTLHREDLAYIGFTCMSSQVGSAINLCKRIKSAAPHIPLVFGGVHPTLLPESVVRTKLVDFSVFGEGDAVVDKIAEYVNGKRSLESIPNIVAYDKSGSLMKTTPAVLTTFDALPTMIHPSLYTEDVDSYIMPITLPEGSYRGFQILTGLGCKYQCAFCINHVTKRRYRSKPAKYILEEMLYLHQQHGINFFVFQEEHFFGDQPRLYEFLQLFEQEPRLCGNVKWTTTVRVTDIKETYLNVDLLKRLIAAGCAGLSTGGESGSDRVLITLRKGTKRADILRAAQYATDAQLSLSFSFVMLWPSETVDEMAETARLIDTILRMGSYVLVPYFQTYRPYPGSVWEPDLSRFEDPEAIPSDIWRMQLVEKDRLTHFPDPDIVFNLITTTQVMCLAGTAAADSPVRKLAKKALFHLCSFRIRRMWFGLHWEKPIINHIVKKYAQF